MALSQSDWNAFLLSIFFVFGRLSIIMTFPQNNSKLVLAAREVFTQGLAEP